MAMAMPTVMIGERHGARVAVGPAYRQQRPGKRLAVAVVCNCGNRDDVDVSAWRRGQANECSACRSKRMVAARPEVHGYSRSAEYQSWLAMRRRCLDPAFEKFPKYGGSGITIFAPWAHSFVAFISDVGMKPGPAYTLDRINVYEGYYPYNVRWATPREQRCNQRPKGEAWEVWENAVTGY